MQILRGITTPHTAPLPHIGWNTTLHHSSTCKVVQLSCFGVPCRVQQGKPNVCVQRNDDDRGILHALVFKFFDDLDARRLCVTTIHPSDTRKDASTVQHYVVLRDKNLILCDPFTLEATTTQLLCGSRSLQGTAAAAAPPPCWRFHLPRHLFHFMQRTPRCLQGGFVITHEGVPLRHWKRGATPLQMLVVLFQVAATLHALQRHLEFKHHDLHDSNVVIMEAPCSAETPKCHRYVVDNMEFFVPNTGVVARIIDFQFATCLTPDGMRLVRGDTFMLYNTSAQIAWWRPMLVREWGYDMQVLLSSLCQQLPTAATPQLLPLLRSCTRALNVRPLKHGGSGPSVASRPTPSTVSAIKPRMFLLRVFGGRGAHALCDWTAPPAQSARSRSRASAVEDDEDDIPTRFACSHAISPPS